MTALDLSPCSRPFHPSSSYLTTSSTRPKTRLQTPPYHLLQTASRKNFNRPNQRSKMTRTNIIEIPPMRSIIRSSLGRITISLLNSNRITLQNLARRSDSNIGGSVDPVFGTLMKCILRFRRGKLRNSIVEVGDSVVDIFGCRVLISSFDVVQLFV
jgi:hypothetical protein